MKVSWSGSDLRWAIRWLVVFAPVAPYLLSLPAFGALPSYDYYGILAQMVDDQGGFTSPLDWLKVRSNEHLIGLAAMIYAANVQVSGGDNRMLSALALMLLAGLLLMTYRWLPAELRRSTWSGGAAGLALSLFIFTPRTAHNVVFGFSGIAWFTANLFAVGAISALRVRASTDSVWRLVPALLIAWIGGFAYSTTVAAWPALVVMGIVLGLRRLQLGVLGTAGLVTCLTTLHGYPRVVGHPHPELDPIRLIVWSSQYLGALFSSDALVAGWLGGVGLVVSVGVALVAITRPADVRRGIAPWIALQAYAATVALSTAVFRAGFNEGPGVWSRYASVPTLFWSGGLVVVGMLAWGALPRTPRGVGLPARAGFTVATVTVVLGLSVPMYTRGWETLQAVLDRAAYQPIAAAALVHGIDDETMLEHLNPRVEEIEWAEPFMRRMRHVPFDKDPPPLGEGALGPVLLAAEPWIHVVGEIDDLSVVDSRMARATGWAYSDSSPVAEVVVVDSAGMVRGRMVMALPRPDVAEVLGASARQSGWSGYVRLRGTGDEMVAYARLQGQEDWVVLDDDGSPRVPRNP